MFQSKVKSNRPKKFLSDDEEENVIFIARPRAKKLYRKSTNNYFAWAAFTILILIFPFMYIMANYHSPQTPSPPILYLEIYLFNWTNPGEFNQTTKPHFTEHGPYVFRELVETKLVLTNWMSNLNTTRTTSSFKEKRTWYFDPSISNGTLDDEITNLNPIAATVNYLARNQSKSIKQKITQAFESLHEELTVTKTVRQLLFDGYDDKLLEFLSSNHHDLEIPFNKFAWFYQKNNSLNPRETFSVWAGKQLKDPRKRGLIAEWHDEKSSFHPGSCGFANSLYDGFWFGVNDTDDTLSVFIPNICSAIQMKFKDNIVLRNVTRQRYVPSAETFDNGTKFPSKSCHCRSGDCLPSGILNISLCKNGAPVFASYPHFYLADESYADAVDGLDPEKEREFNLVIKRQEFKGILLQSQVGIQMNFLIEPVEDVKMFEDLPRTFVPMIWYQQNRTYQDDEFHSGGFDPRTAIVGLMIIGILAVSFVVWISLKETVQEAKFLSGNITNSDPEYSKCPRDNFSL